MIRALASLSVLLAGPVMAGVVEGDSPDPLAELNALYAQICQWDEGISIPYETIDLTHDGIDDYLLSYDLSCRGQANAFTGSDGMARQIWISDGPEGYTRILDANVRDLTLETRDGRPFVVLHHKGSFCMTADAAPCFLTLEFTENTLVWAEAHHQHPSMTARLAAMKAAQEETTND